MHADLYELSPFPQRYCPSPPTSFPLLPVDPIKIQPLRNPVEHTKIISYTVETFQWQLVLLKCICDNLKAAKVKTQHFYITPKVHKKDMPGRLFVSSIDCHTSKISKLINHHLQPHTKALPSYVQGTTDFTKKLEAIKDKSKDSILVILHVQALHTNIPNQSGIDGVKEMLK